MPTLSARIMGKKRPVISPRELSLQVEGSLSLRELITSIVVEELEAYRKRSEERKLFRILTEAEISEGALLGKVEMGGREAEDEIHGEEALQCALQAFEDGLYLVFIDNERVQALDEPVVLKDKSEITFVRLIALAGG